MRVNCTNAPLSRASHAFDSCSLKEDLITLRPSGSHMMSIAVIAKALAACKVGACDASAPAITEGIAV